MKDVSSKIETLRTAKARAKIMAGAETLDLVRSNAVPKGNVLETARAAGIMAAKKTPELIPLCHQIPLDTADIEFEIEEDGITVTSFVKAIWKTGVEMEALTAAAVASLTIYDMLKPLDTSLEICEIKLVEKKGGKSDWKESYREPLKTAILVLSDSVSSGKKEDKSGKIIKEKLNGQPVEVVVYEILPDELEMIKTKLVELSDGRALDLILTTGGTGLSPRDVTVEATIEVIEREVPGISEAGRSYGFSRTPHAMLSRGVSGIRGKTVIINLPGSSRGVAETMDALFPWVLHSFRILRGGDHPAGK
ncbi:MAG TPA: bifunctional molybdenum cofactor biosynthesis protein MoaC/MoaB [Thermodesulfobacteriota bacterium]|nr:bifunctional molybdenum cofactor biosynthesis protein MoaC/MoaB [Thermodesulfobacteriota bacterium]